MLYTKTILTKMICQEEKEQQEQQNQKTHDQEISNKMRHEEHKTKASSVNCIRGDCSNIWYVTIAILICLLANGISRTNAVPTDSRNVDVTRLLQRRVLRDVTTNAMLAVEPTAQAHAKEQGPSSMEIQPIEPVLPQGHCLLDGIWLPENTAYCEKQPGCLAIQRTGHCCPDYKCDCEKDGKTYRNGDILADQNNPCTVCYCKGGEINCSPVTCFHRDDCKPLYIEGRCCPEYDNCPILSTTTTTTTPIPTDILINSAKKLEMPGYNWNITIKEITKPTEIRITDAKPKTKPLIQMRKSSTTEAPPTTTTTTTSTTTTTAPASSTTVDSVTTPTPISLASPIKPLSIEIPLSTTNETMTIGKDKKSSFSVDKIYNNFELKAPEKAIPVHTGERLKLVASTAYGSSSVAEKAKNQQTEIVTPLRLEPSNAPELSLIEVPVFEFETDAPIKIVVDNLGTDDPAKMYIKREYMVTTEGVAKETNEQAIVENQANLFGSNGLILDVLNEPEAAGSDNIYHILRTTDGPKSSLDKMIRPIEEKKKTSKTVTTTTSTTSAPTTTTTTTTSQPPLKVTTESNTISDYLENDSIYNISTSTFVYDDNSTDIGNAESSTDLTAQSTTESSQHMEEDDSPPIEVNPAYPSLPEDDFSLRDLPLIESDDLGEVELKEEQRSIVVTYDMHKQTKQLDDEVNPTIMDIENGSGNDNGSGSDSSSIPVQTIMYTLSNTLSPQVDMNVPFIYSGEESSGETAIQNATDFQLDKLTKNNDTSDEDSQETDLLEAMISSGGGSGSGSGSGSGEMLAVMKQREYTTPKPTRRSSNDLDIDEITQSGDEPAEDPKLDAESLKLDESIEKSDNLSKMSASEKGNLRAEKSAEPAETASNPDAVVQRIQRLYLHRVY